jgi:hypothetical protein
VRHAIALHADVFGQATPFVYQGEFRELAHYETRAFAYEPSQQWYSQDAQDVEKKAQGLLYHVRRFMLEQTGVIVASGLLLLLCQVAILVGLLK